MTNTSSKAAIALSLVALLSGADCAMAQNSAAKPAGGAATTDSTNATNGAMMKPVDGTAPGTDMPAPAMATGAGTTAGAATTRAGGAAVDPAAK